MIGHGRCPLNVYIMKNKQFRETRIQGVRLSISRNRCSITRWRFVLLNDGKKRRRSKIGAIFKSIGIVILKTIEVVVALSPVVELALIILNWLGW